MAKKAGKSKKVEEDKKEKKQAKAEERKIDRKTRATENKQLIYALIIMAGIILAVALIYFAIHESKKFEYIGLKFEKKADGFYYTKMSIVSSSGQPADYDFKLINDPRKLKDIPIEGLIRFRKDNITYVSVDTALYKCDDLYISLIDLGIFLRAIGIEATSSVSPDLNFSIERDIAYVTCDNMPDNTVLLIQNSSQNKIEHVSDCYTINIANCEANKLIERFMLGTIAHYRGYEI